MVIAATALSGAIFYCFGGKAIYFTQRLIDLRRTKLNREADLLELCP